MKLSYKMSKQEWKELLDYLKTIPNVHITYYARTDNKGYFKDFKYITFEHCGAFYYLEDGSTDLTNFHVVRYSKISPYERQQNSYRHYIHSTEELLEYMEHTRTGVRLNSTRKQRIYLMELYKLRNGRTDLWYLTNELAGNREKEILQNLAHITMERNTDDYCVLRFHSTDGNYFDYETKSRRITG